MTLPGSPGPAGSRDEGWRRLDKRMLLIHPLETLIRAFPALLAIFVVQLSSDDSDRWELVALPVIVAFGLLRWVTTRYRVGADQIELRRGLFTKQLTTARLDKVRSVDLTAEVHHRVLGLAKVEISTGSAAKERIVLDALGRREGQRLRAELLHHVDSDLARHADPLVEPVLAALPAPTGAAVDLPPPPPREPAPATEIELLRLEPGWIRFAPFTMTGIGSAAALFGFATQGLNRFSGEDAALEAGAEWIRGLAWWVDLIGVVLIVSLLAIGAYVLSFWGFRLARSSTGTLHTRRGLLTSREVGIDHLRMRGAEVGEQLGLRLAGGRRLKAVSTGLQGEAGGGSDWLSPPAPRSVVEQVAAEVVADPAAVTGNLEAHGPAARRRRLRRALAFPVIAAGVLGLGRLWLGWPLWPYWLVLVAVLAAFFLGADRYRGLGHLVTPEHLVSRNGSLDRRRVMLQRSGVIGWTIEQSFFQRRAGVVTLVATTAAGAQHYGLVDLTTERAYEVVGEVTPELLTQFT